MKKTKRNLRYSLLLVLGLFMHLFGNAQNINITGHVDDDDNYPIPGVSIVIKGTTTGTVTNVDGNYSIAGAGPDDTLIFTFIGMESQEIEIGAKTVINIILKNQTQGLDEVMVVAYGAQKKETVVGAITQIKGKALTRTGQTTISNSLAGQIPGVVTVQPTGLPGAAEAKIYVRGLSSFSGDNQPLVLVDGVERSLSNIDPSEVENISVLKDASATAVYGVKGANGVILVTTKRGQLGRMEINVTAEATFVKPSLKRDLENSYNTLYYLNKVNRNSQQWDQVRSDEELEHYRVQDMPYVYPDTDPSDLMLGDFGKDYKVNISARGGTEDVKYYVSLGAIKEGGVFKDGATQKDYDPGYKYKRYNFRTNLDFDITNTTKISVSAGGYVGKSSKPGSTYNYIPNYILYDAPYDSPFIYPESFVEEHPDSKWPYGGQRLAGSYVVQGEQTGYFLYNHTGTTGNTKHRIGTDFKIAQKLDFITKGLSFNGMISYNHEATYGGGAYKAQKDFFVFKQTGPNEEDYEWFRYTDKGDEDYTTIIRPAYSNQLTRGNFKPSKNFVYQLNFNYRKVINDIHTINALALFKRRESTEGNEFSHYEEDWVGKLTYDYKSRYVVEFNAGYTGSEQFAPENRFGFFPAAGLSWNVSNEPFFKEAAPWANLLKLSYSYGETGASAASGWLYRSEYKVDGTGADTGDTDTSKDLRTLMEDKVANPVAQWERSIKNNIRLEVGVLNMFNLSVDFWNDKRDGILMARRSLPDWFGQAVKSQNIGETKIHGYELALDFKKKFGEVDFWANTNFNFNENRVVSRDDPFYLPDYLKDEGMPINQNSSSYNIGYYQNMDDMLNYSVGRSIHQTIGTDMILDFNGDGIIDSKDAVPNGYTTRANYSFGFSAGANYKNFDFSFLLQGNSGVSRQLGSRYNPMSSSNGHYILYNDRSDDVWSPDNRNAEHAAWGTWNPQQKSRIHAYYVRLKSIQLGYNFESGLINNLGLSKLRVYFQGNNLLTYAPEVTVGDPEAEPGKENNNYPVPKRFTFGVKVNF